MTRDSAVSGYASQPPSLAPSEETLPVLIHSFAPPTANLSVEGRSAPAPTSSREELERSSDRSAASGAGNRDRMAVMVAAIIMGISTAVLFFG
jgi:hypothetical protein